MVRSHLCWSRATSELGPESNSDQNRPIYIYLEYTRVCAVSEFRWFLRLVEHVSDDKDRQFNRLVRSVGSQYTLQTPNRTRNGREIDIWNITRAAHDPAETLYAAVCRATI